MNLRGPVVVVTTLGVALALTLSLAHRGAQPLASSADAGASAPNPSSRSVSADIARAQIVVEVHVDNVGGATWSSPDGSAPDLQMLRSTNYQILPVTPLQLTVGKVYKGTGSNVPRTFWLPGGDPPVGPGRLYSSVSSSTTLPDAGADVIMFLGDTVDWRHGHGDPQPAREVQQLCTLSVTGASCQGYTLSTDQLQATLAAAN